MPELTKLSTALVAIIPGEIREPIEVDRLRDLLSDPGLEVASLTAGAERHLRMRSLRAQMDVAVEAKRISVADQSETAPARDGFVSTALDLVAYFSTQGSTGYGWNLDVTFQSGGEPAASEIAGKLIRSSTSEVFSPDPLLSANVVVVYATGGVRYTVKMEPRYGKLDSETIYAHIVAHRDNPLPQQVEQARQELAGARDELARVLDGIFP